MSTRPKALQLADALSASGQFSALADIDGSAAELRRLHSLNAQMLDALTTILAVVGLTAFKHESQRAVLQEARGKASAAIAAAQEQS